MITLAIQMNSLARYSKRTIQLRRAVSHYSCQVSRSFNSLVRVLFSVPSRYCTLSDLVSIQGSKLILHSRSVSSERYSGTYQSMLASIYGTIALYGKPFQVTSIRQTKDLRQSTKPHLPILSVGIQFALCCFQSPLLTASLLISFPTGTKMFQFPVFPYLPVLMRSRIRKSLDQRLRAPPQSILQLVTSFFS